LVAYPLAGRHALYEGFRPADGLLNAKGKGVRLLCSEEATENSVLLLGCDPAFPILKEYVFRKAPEARIYCRFTSSCRALESLGAGYAHIAGTHLHNTGNTEANVSLAKKSMAGSGATIIGFSSFEEGLMVAPGNPLGIKKIEDLAQQGIRFVNRENGAALRILLDDYLDKANIPHTAISGYLNKVSNHFEGAQIVANHLADAVLGLRAVAGAFELDFIPIKTVRCDLVIPDDLVDHPSVRIILDILQTQSLHHELSTLPGYDASHTGKLIAKV
jgi:molybdate-binding protein